MFTETICIPISGQATLYAPTLNCCIHLLSYFMIIIINYSSNDGIATVIHIAIYCMYYLNYSMNVYIVIY